MNPNNCSGSPGGMCACRVERLARDYRHNPKSAGILVVQSISSTACSDRTRSHWTLTAGDRPSLDAVLLVIDAPHCEQCPSPRPNQRGIPGNDGRIYQRAGWWVPGDGTDNRMRRLVSSPAGDAVEALCWVPPAGVAKAST